LDLFIFRFLNSLSLSFFFPALQLCASVVIPIFNFLILFNFSFRSFGRDALLASCALDLPLVFLFSSLGFSVLGNLSLFFVNFL